MGKILGISAYYHDSAAVLLNDGDIAFAVHEERLSRKKHDSAFPALSVEACLRHGINGAPSQDFRPGRCGLLRQAASEI